VKTIDDERMTEGGRSTERRGEVQRGGEKDREEGRTERREK